MPNSKSKDKSPTRGKTHSRLVDRFRHMTRFFSNPTLSGRKPCESVPTQMQQSILVNNLSQPDREPGAQQKQQPEYEQHAKKRHSGGHEKWKKLSLTTLKRRHKQHLSVLPEVPFKAATFSTARAQSVTSSSYWTVSESNAEIQVTELDDFLPIDKLDMPVVCSQAHFIAPSNQAIFRSSIASVEESVTTAIICSPPRVESEHVPRSGPLGDGIQVDR
ncbi:unnamed protein product [Echinostoma caproni]|uniref:Uncharacterized protein n=1 Tax=Echinostoma caproni TaxID=27848 RepID=A0A183AQI3_9TREM|nr:unnamed protein product [Echinostoma caproni]